MTTVCTRAHTHAHNSDGLHTVTAGKEQQEKRHISPLHSPLRRVVGVLVGYSPEFTVKRKQWPRQNRSWRECTKNRRCCGTRSDRQPDRRRSVAPIFPFFIAISLIAASMRDRWPIDDERTNERNLTRNAFQTYHHHHPFRHRSFLECNRVIIEVTVESAYEKGKKKDWRRSGWMINWSFPRVE